MIFGIGTDVVNVARMQESISRHGDRFAQRILAEVELETYNKSHQPTNFLAKRFAAKEAMAKAFGTGFRNGLSLQHIAVVNDELGKPQLVLNGYALALKNNLNIGEMHISLSDEKEYAVAFVILMKA